MRQTGRARYLTKALIALALAIGVLIVFAYPAEAHSNLVGSEPEAGSVVRQLDHIVLRFAEPVETAGVHVWIDDDGGTYELGPAQHFDGDDRAIVVPVPRIASGRYTVGFHLIADDLRQDQFAEPRSAQRQRGLVEAPRRNNAPGEDIRVEEQSNSPLARHFSRWPRECRREVLLEESDFL
jgi:methionine-rich copper-binding protein CopC